MTCVTTVSGTFSQLDFIGAYFLNSLALFIACSVPDIVNFDVFSFVEIRLDLSLEVRFKLGNNYSNNEVLPCSILRSRCLG